MKSIYVCPKLKRHGSIEDLTLASWNWGSGDMFLDVHIVDQETNEVVGVIDGENALSVS